MEKIEKVEEQDIKVAEPMDLRPTELPLVITLPADASKAQIAYARVLNGYAYKNPTKWAEKKDDRTTSDGIKIKGFLTKLRELKNAPDPVEEGNLKYGNKLLS